MPSDMRLFKRLTLGKPVIMGRKTFQSLKGPLVDRDNIVVTRDPAFTVTGVHVARSLDEAVALARTLATARGATELAVIGGAEIYRAALPLAHRIYLTRVHATPDGDTWLPDLPASQWRETGRAEVEADPKDAYPATLLTLDRV
jgi:dihydrofolate reductase